MLVDRNLSHAMADAHIAVRDRRRSPTNRRGTE
jgi:hypothetical protein